MTLQKTFMVWLVSLVVVIAIIATVLLSSREANRLNLQLAQRRLRPARWMIRSMPLVGAVPFLRTAPSDSVVRRHFRICGV